MHAENKVISIAVDGVADSGGTAGRAPPKGRRGKWPNGVSYTTLDLVNNGFYDNTPVSSSVAFIEPEGIFEGLEKEGANDERNNEGVKITRPVSAIPPSKCCSEILFQHVE